MRVVPYENQPLKGVQRVLQSGNDVEDHGAAPQGPQSLFPAEEYAVKPIDLAVYNVPLASSVDGKAREVVAKAASVDLHFWGQSLGEVLELARIKAEELGLTSVAIDLEEWVKAHPWKAGFYAASALGFFAPEILSIPALEALGFGVAGVRAGVSVPHPDRPRHVAY